MDTDKGEYDDDDTTSTTDSSDSDDDIVSERKSRRREQNRVAAQRCRDKKKTEATSVVQDYKKYLSANTEVRHTIKTLQKEKEQLEIYLAAHLKGTDCNIQNSNLEARFSVPVVPLRSASNGKNNTMHCSRHLVGSSVREQFRTDMTRSSLTNTPASTGSQRSSSGIQGHQPRAPTSQFPQKIFIRPEYLARLLKERHLAKKRAAAATITRPPQETDLQPPSDNSSLCSSAKGHEPVATPVAARRNNPGIIPTVIDLIDDEDDGGAKRKGRKRKFPAKLNSQISTNKCKKEERVVRTGNTASVGIGDTDSSAKLNVVDQPPTVIAAKLQEQSMSWESNLSKVIDESMHQQRQNNAGLWHQPNMQSTPAAQSGHIITYVSGDDIIPPTNPQPACTGNVYLPTDIPVHQVDTPYSIAPNTIPSTDTQYVHHQAVNPAVPTHGLGVLQHQHGTSPQQPCLNHLSNTATNNAIDIGGLVNMSMNLNYGTLGLPATICSSNYTPTFTDLDQSVSGNRTAQSNDIYNENVSTIPYNYDNS